jgi:hypothetical protein
VVGFLQGKHNRGLVSESGLVEQSLKVVPTEGVFERFEQQEVYLIYLKWLKESKRTKKSKEMISNLKYLFRGLKVLKGL